MVIKTADLLKCAQGTVKLPTDWKIIGKKKKVWPSEGPVRGSVAERIP